MNRPTILILGAKSDISKAVIHNFAKSNYDIQLAARKSVDLKNFKSDIELRYLVQVTLHEFDALNIKSHESFIDSLPKLPTVAFCAVGYMGDHTKNKKDIISAANVIRSNFEGPASILAVISNRFEQRNYGTIIGVSSVAGERGRATNYVYGSAKAGFTTFLSGLRNRLAKTNVHVITVLPGFVSTKMTEKMNLPLKLTAQPKEVANIILSAVKQKKNIIYVKKIWWFIMFIIRNIPEHFFKKLKI